MSRVGKTLIVIPNGVTLEVAKTSVQIKGPKGELILDLPAFLHLEVQNQQATVSIKGKGPEFSSRQGLFRSLLQNAITGVDKGWEKSLELVGVGYKVEGGANEITLNVGFTHSVKMTAPKDVAFKIADNKILVTGIDKKEVGETAAKIRAIKPPEPYKGKGIRYTGEVVRKKAGKAVKAVGAPA